jgi:acetoin utilization deacetylase AcuC-like enzyme
MGVGFPPVFERRGRVRCVYSPKHRLHDPRREVQFGIPVDTYEIPARAESIRAALAADGGFPMQEPSDHGLEPIAAVHDESLVTYLSEAWTEWAAWWAAEGPRADTERNAGAPELVADSFLHPAFREGMGPASDEPRGYPVARLGWWSFDTTTPIVAGTYEAARSSVDVALTAADLVMDGERAAYGLCRPPGHHAPRAALGGYCFFNNAAIVAERVARQTGEPVAILDVDYHHGNGTQQIFYSRGDVLYVSLHGDPDRAYPYFAGWAEERGSGDGEGATLNFPLRARCPDEEYVAAMAQGLDAIRRFGGTTLVVSLGMDTYRRDPISDLALTTRAYHRIGELVESLGRRTVILQEGGYHVGQLGENVRQWLRGFEGREYDGTGDD